MTNPILSDMINVEPEPMADYEFAAWNFENSHGDCLMAQFQEDDYFVVWQFDPDSGDYIDISISDEEIAEIKTHFEVRRESDFI